MTSLEALLTGQTESHTVDFFQGIRVHQAVEKPLRAMTQEASKEGHQLRVVSGYRSFERQIHIWNSKVAGKRPEGFTDEEIIYQILRWSALPGTSRHHWGTDLDIIDAAKLTPTMTVKLVPEEFEPGGPFSELHDWLDQNMSRFGFFRPYKTDRGGVNPERWHLSYAPLAQSYLSQLTETLVFDALTASPLELKKTVQDLLPEIFKRYILNVDLP